MNPITFWAWNICAGGQFPSYDNQNQYGPTPRLNTIASEISFFAPDVVAIIDAFGWNKWPTFLFDELFPQYRLEGVYPVGDIDIVDLNYAILVKHKIPKGVVTSEIQLLTNYRNVVSLRIYETRITVAYLEANKSSKRKEELKALLRTNADLIVGDLNTIFIDARRTFFTSPGNVFQHWRVLGLWIVSSLIRGMFVPPGYLQTIIGYPWSTPLLFHSLTFGKFSLSRAGKNGHLGYGVISYSQLPYFKLTTVSKKKLGILCRFSFKLKSCTVTA